MRPKPPYYWLLDLALTFTATFILATGVVVTIEAAMALARHWQRRLVNRLERVRSKQPVRFISAS